MSFAATCFVLAACGGKSGAAPAEDEMPAPTTIAGNESTPTESRQAGTASPSSANTSARKGVEGVAFRTLGHWNDDPATPAGVIVGMDIEDASARLIAAGYQPNGPCVFKKKEQLTERYTSTSINLSSASEPNRNECIERIKRLIFDYQINVHLPIADEITAERLLGVSTQELNDYFDAKFQKAGICDRSDFGRKCAWNLPSAFPQMKSTEVEWYWGRNGGRIKAESVSFPDLDRGRRQGVDLPVSNSFSSFSSVPAFREVNVLRPGGFAVGMSALAVRDALMNAGYDLRGGCEWFFELPKEQIITYNIGYQAPGKLGSCLHVNEGTPADAVVTSISFVMTYHVGEFPDPSEMLALARKYVGVEEESGECQMLTSNDGRGQASCKWTDITIDGIAGNEVSFGYRSGSIMAGVDAVEFSKKILSGR